MRQQEGGERPNPYAVITDRIVAQLEAGTVPWHKPWRTRWRPPRNLVSKRAYRGVNVFVLALLGEGHPPWWLTYRQASELGGHVKKGEHGIPIAFWKQWTPSQPRDVGEVDEGGGQRRFLRWYTVFNVDQVEGLDASIIPGDGPEPTLEERLERAAGVVRFMPRPPQILTLGNKAAYSRRTDTVTMPAMSQMESQEAYYGTLFHELIHATGHESRLNRPELGNSRFGDDGYSREELVAEMGAAFLAGETGILSTTLDNTAAYIAHWLGKLKDDRRLLVVAAQQAQRAADFVLARRVEESSEAAA